MTGHEDLLVALARAGPDDGCRAAEPDLADRAARAAWLLGGPRGLGTSGCRVHRLGLGLGLLPFTEREWGDGSPCQDDPADIRSLPHILHNQLTRDLKRNCRHLTTTIAAPQLHAYVRGAQAWMAG